FLEDQVQRGVAAFVKARVDRETAAFTGFERDAVEALIGDAETAFAGFGERDAEKGWIGGIQRRVGGELEPAAGLGAGGLAPAEQRHSMFEGAVLDQLGIEPAIRGVINVLKKQAMQRRRNVDARPIQID